MKKLLYFLFFYAGILLAMLHAMPLLASKLTGNNDYYREMDPYRASLLMAFAGLWILIAVFYFGHVCMPTKSVPKEPEMQKVSVSFTHETYFEIQETLRSTVMMLNAHPDNEPDSEFADRIDDIEKLMTSLDMPLPFKFKL